MKKTRLALIMISCVQIVVAFLLLTYSPAPVLSVNAFAWCDGGCGGCGMYGADSATCAATGCGTCGCFGTYDGTAVSYLEDCPGLVPE